MNEQPQNAQKRKTIVYIDGFNLYFALREKNWRGFMWLDVIKLSEKLLRPDQELVLVRYFTSRIKNNPEKQKRQTMYLEALGTLDGSRLAIHYGDYQSIPLTCHHCNKVFQHDQEKQTDVNISVYMILDSISKREDGSDKVDDIILITADSDQCPSVRAARSIGKNVLVVLPPGRGEYIELPRSADSRMELTAKKLKDCRLPDTITKSDGFEITCPSKWTIDAR
jgi:uncharacterized LabA/DUF88 family protein